MISLGIDIGTTTVSAVLYDTATCTEIEAVTVPNDSAVPSSSPDESYQDPEKIIRICLQLKECLCAKYQVDCIGITGQMHGAVYTDLTGKAVGDLATWQDGRCSRRYKGGMTYCEYIEKTTRKKVPTGYGIASLFFDTVNDRIPPFASHICTIPDYAVMRFCGLQAPVVHRSNAASIGLFNLLTGRFLEDRIRALGIEPRFLPEVISEERFVGCTEDGIPVCAAIGDNQAGYLGTAGTEPSLLANIGTGSQISAVCEAPIDDPLLECRPFVDGKYLLVGAALCGGSAYAMLKDLIAEAIRLGGGEVPDGLYGLMDKAAEVCRLPAPRVDVSFNGTRSDPRQTGWIDRITPENFNIGSLAYGFMEGICRELREYYSRIRRYTGDIEFYFMGGNALRNSRIFRWILCRTFDKTFLLSDHREEAAFGAALCAAHVLTGFDYSRLFGVEETL